MAEFGNLPTIDPVVEKLDGKTVVTLGTVHFTEGNAAVRAALEDADVVELRDPGSKEIEIGALALGDGDIADVGAGASAHHARLVREGAAWFVRDLGSTNGTEIVSGATGERMVVHEGLTSRLSAGDRLVLGDDTVFIVIEGVPGA